MRQTVALSPIQPIRLTGPGLGRACCTGFHQAAGGVAGDKRWPCRLGRTGPSTQDGYQARSQRSAELGSIGSTHHSVHEGEIGVAQKRRVGRARDKGGQWRALGAAD